MKIDGVDLRNDPRIVYRLLDGHMGWRSRAVERIEYSSSLWMERTRIVHVSPLRELLDPLIPSHYGTAWLRLPIGSFPRQLLFGFDVEVAGREVYRISKAEHEQLVKNYIVEHARRLTHAIRLRGGVAGDLELVLLEKQLHRYLAAISAFEAGAWCEAKLKYGNDALVRYLQKGLYPTGASRDELWVIRNSVADWKEQLQPVLPTFSGSEELLQTSNPAENPLLVLPSLKARNALDEIGNIPTALSNLVDFLGVTQQWTESERGGQEIQRKAERVLELYEYVGEFWIAIADCLVPLDEPFMLTVRERRAIEPGRRRHSIGGVRSWVTIKRNDLGPRVIFRDAHANHVSIGIADPNVEFGKGLEVTHGQAGSRIPVGQDATQEEKEDLILVYSSKVGRPPAPNIRCSIQPVLPIRMIHWVVAIIVFVTFGALVWGSIHFGQLAAAHVALLLTPSTFASALLLSRESSALSGTLARQLRVTIAVLMGALWLFAICQYLAGQIYLGGDPQPNRSPRPSPVSSTATH
ncbi:hypothetical protein [Streptomyces sp. NPDC085540]|uniref:hypothetical protein n=1 Tax=Streptomyces sp. NPDC085540 TaxID=3365730 RepID=UPI0037CEBF95